MKIARQFTAGFVRQWQTRPEGTIELFPQVSFVVFDPMLFQQRDEFLLETHLAVMRLLAFDIANDPVHCETLTLNAPYFVYQAKWR